jgi:hypothetical protein
MAKGARRKVRRNVVRAIVHIKATQEHAVCRSTGGAALRPYGDATRDSRGRD